jgi:hypothetical protein
MTLDEAWDTVYDNRRGTRPKRAIVPHLSGGPDDMRAEYDFDYRKARLNRFAGRVDKSRLVVTLDPNVSEVFATPEAVNAVLRALIATLPTARSRVIRESGPVRARRNTTNDLLAQARALQRIGRAVRARHGEPLCLL